MSSSKAKKHLTQEERTRVASSMCHNVATADRFYCPVPNVTELFQVRGLRMKALLEDADTREEEDSSSVEEGEPSFDDSYVPETPPTPRSPTAQRESTSEEDLNTGTPPTHTSPASQQDPPSDEYMASMELEESDSEEPDVGSPLKHRVKKRKLSFSGAVVEKSGVITGPKPPATNFQRQRKRSEERRVGKECRL